MTRSPALTRDGPSLLNHSLTPSQFIPAIRLTFPHSSFTLDLCGFQKYGAAIHLPAACIWVVSYRNFWIILINPYQFEAPSMRRLNYLPLMGPILGAKCHGF